MDNKIAKKLGLARSAATVEAGQTEVGNTTSDDYVVMTDDKKETTDEELGQLNLITQITRANLIQNIIGHQWMMPSKKELDYYNPSKTPGTITGHLNKLVDENLVHRLHLPQGEQELQSPNTFFALTDEGWSLLRSHALFVPELDDIRSDHANVEKTEEIKRYENARRPTIDVSYPHPLKGDGRTIVDPVEYGGDPDDNDEDQKRRLMR